MPKGKNHNSERVHYRDARTGTPILQVTNFPCISISLGYYAGAFTPDSQRILLLSQREASRDAPYDLFRVDVNGANLVQLTDTADLSGCAISPAGDAVFFMRGQSLWKLDLETFEEAELSHCSAVPVGGNGVVAPNGRYYFASAPIERFRTHMVRFATDGSEEPLVTEVPYGPIVILSHDPGGRGTMFYSNDAAGTRLQAMVGPDLEDLGVWPGSRQYAHVTFLGKTGKLQGCALPPNRQLLVCDKDDIEPTVIAEGPYFWHSCGWTDENWIIADTNWPDRGLQLVHVPTGRYAPLCYPESSMGAPQWTHPHPQLSPDGRYALYGSDRTGCPQVYLAEITDEFRAHVQDGVLDAFANTR
jgi:oligogalacturonide lyase